MSDFFHKWNNLLIKSNTLYIAAIIFCIKELIVIGLSHDGATIGVAFILAASVKVAFFI